jgi:DNA (cytosine-5)-methyltransferase 1
MKKKISGWLSGLDLKGELKISPDEYPALVTHLYHQQTFIENDNFYINPLFMSEKASKKILESIPSEIAEQADNAPFRDNPPFRFSFIDLFAGIGGFRISLKEQGGLCVFSSESDNSAKKTYFKNYGEFPFGNIKQFTGEHISDADLNNLIPNHDVLAAGFPCQPFSHAGVSARKSLNKEHGFNCNTQGTLFFDIMRIASIKKPKVLLLENVRNLKSHDAGRTFETIKEAILNLGYSFNHALINAQALVPQKRVRCYMVAVRNDIPDFKFDLAEYQGPPIALETILEDYEIAMEYQISQKLWDGHINRTKRNIERGTGFTALETDITKPANTLVARYGKDGKECLIPTLKGPPRKLTKREAARIQGFPEKFILPDAKTPTYKQMGNSVAVPVVTRLAQQIISHLDKNNEL